MGGCDYLARVAARRSCAAGWRYEANSPTTAQGVVLMAVCVACFDSSWYACASRWLMHFVVAELGGSYSIHSTSTRPGGQRFLSVRSAARTRRRSVACISWQAWREIQARVSPATIAVGVGGFAGDAAILLLLPQPASINVAAMHQEISDRIRGTSV